MLFGMTWWASLFVLFGLLIIITELGALSEDEVDEGEEKSLDFVIFCGRLFYYVALIAMTILIFQDRNNVFVEWTVISTAILCTPISLWFAVSELISFAKLPAGEPDESGEQTGILFNGLGHLAIIAYFSAGIAIAISATRTLWISYV
jgi:hypothetical protein